jgi:hypothetical protein
MQTLELIFNTGEIRLEIMVDKAEMTGGSVVVGSRCVSSCCDCAHGSVRASLLRNTVVMCFWQAISVMSPSTKPILPVDAFNLTEAVTTVLRLVCNSCGSIGGKDYIAKTSETQR